MFEFSQLRCFVTVAETLHFRRAAARLHMTQPPLSRQVQLLEHAVGARLLERSRRAVRLTPAGQVFVRAARQMLELAEAATLDARRVARGEAGAVTIGFTAAAGYAVLPRLAARLRASLPGLSLGFREMVTSEQLDALQRGELDFGLLRPPVARTGLTAVRVEREPLLVALPPGHALSGLAAVPVEALAGESLITYPPVEGRYLHDLAASLFHVAGVAPGQTQHISQAHSILSLVGAGLGIALVPRAVERLQPRDVVLRPLQGAEQVQADLLLAWPTAGANPAAPTVLAALRAEWPGLPGA